MRRPLLLGTSVLLLILVPPGGTPAPAPAGERPPVQAAAPFGLGRVATPAEISAWDIAVGPDGRGLPAGQGTARRGAALYAERCAACHGATGREGPFDPLVGREPRAGFPFGADPRYVKTIGNYWPYATTLYDYLNRAMPLDRPGSLSPDQIYSLVAYLLWRNELISDSAVIDRHTLPRVVMPAHDRFVVDDRKGGAEVR